MSEQPHPVIEPRPKAPNGHGKLPGPLIIAGPCSAETEEQVLTTARALQHSGISYFRAGIWKPRTHPDSFEGVGEKGLPWLKRVREETGLLPAIEVANSQHVELALKYDIPMLWIGARSSVNPFTVQEIADALRGVDKPVMVKNPINPDLKLWIGAIERVRRAGVKAVYACHRGFNVYGQVQFRNAPLWEIPIDLKRKLPEIPIICDPSHISGKREYIPEVARKALDLGFEGLMIETHPNPGDAWSDPDQQLTPANLLRLLEALSFKSYTFDDDAYRNQLKYLRESIDQVDGHLMRLLKERMDISRQIGHLKQENNVAFYQYNRWNAIIESCRKMAEELGLHEDFVLKLFSLIHLESIDIQGE